MKIQMMSILMAGMLAVSSVTANERVDHAQGKPAETLEQAVANFSEGNRQLSELLATKPMTPDVFHEIHMLSYTLENALKKINEEFAALADTLEEVHLGSERMDEGAVVMNGEDYLAVAGKVVK
ncbi:DUF6746 family protein [Paracandidimonas soli]|uniref:Uncharacterized protein n=1 Tax=Paracandidimonas soli TaxID=1917182 RepID=A0A4R3V5I7_9BURK|nr:DUF6746 family protein [Paracandidimonas soli]TCU99070.1 hypothetical protein EV686_104169 [Paracandidimonas soli]